MPDEYLENRTKQCRTTMQANNHNRARPGYNKDNKNNMVDFLRDAALLNNARRAEIISWERGEWQEVGLLYRLFSRSLPYILCLNFGQLQAEHVIALTEVGVDVSDWLLASDLSATHQIAVTLMVR